MFTIRSQANVPKIAPKSPIDRGNYFKSQAAAEKGGLFTAKSQHIKPYQTKS